jgi:predicted transcriptional regulator
VIRTQIYLDEKIHNRLQEVARRQHRTISELVREALARVYGETSLHELRRTLSAIEGLWKDRDDIGDTRAYVRRLRRGTRRKRRLGI